MTRPEPRPSASSNTLARIIVAAALVFVAGGSGYVATRWFASRDVAATTAKRTLTSPSAAAKPTTTPIRPAAAGTTTAAADGAGAPDVASTASAAPTESTGSVLPDGVTSHGATATTAIAAAAPSANIPPIPGETSLEVRSLPAGAKVIFGGHERGVTPLVITGLVPGRHDVMVEGPFPRVLRRVDVTEGSRALLIVGNGDAANRVSPGQPVATAAAPPESAPAPAATDASLAPSVRGNGAAAPATPTTPRAPASSTAGASAPGTGSGNATAGPQSAPSAPVPAPAPAAATTGRLIVQSPLALDVIANGRRIGNSGDGSLTLTPGSHELELINDSVDYREVTTVHISAGQRLVLPVEVPQSTLTVEASPGTRVWVDGRDVGEVGHAQLALPIGPHEVRFLHPDFGERRITALVKIGLAARAAVDFKASQP